MKLLHLFILPLLTSLLTTPAYDFSILSDYFIYDIETSSITGLSENGLQKDMLRIYGPNFNKEHIILTSVTENAFDNARYSSIMISKSITSFKPSLEGKTIYYTGNEEEFNDFILNNGIDKEKLTYIYYEACDEGFVEFWNNEVAILDGGVCSILLEEHNDLFNKMNNLYSNLLPEDIVNINKNVDEDGYTIKTLVDYINSLTKPETPPSRSRSLSKDTMVKLILFVSGIGITAIFLFYSLKNKDIIE